MRLLILLLLPSLIFGYADPPISQVVGNNTLTAQALDEYYNASAANNSTVHLQFGGYDTGLNVSAYLDIVGPSVLVDNMTYPMKGLSLIVAHGYKQEHLLAFPSEGNDDFVCDYEWFAGGAQYAGRCDFDGDSCPEFENRTFVLYDMDITFAFRNISESVPLTSTLVQFPPAVLEEMRDSSGSEFLNVSLNGNVTFIYEIDNRTYGFGGCGSSYTNVSTSIPFSINRSYVVGGEHKLFFLRSPVLREQWFRNNRFDVVVLSQSPLYHATVFLNGDESRNFTLRNFSVASDQYGIQQILSNRTNETSCSEGKSNGTTPVQLEYENHSFSYIYEFNHSYDGLGPNNLSLLVADNFLGSAGYNESLLSRMLSYNSTTTETGIPADENLSRKSAAFKKDEMSSLRIGFGLVAFIILLAFLNFWLVR